MPSLISRKADKKRSPVSYLQGDYIELRTADNTTVSSKVFPF